MLRCRTCCAARVRERLGGPLARAYGGVVDADDYPARKARITPLGGYEPEIAADRTMSSARFGLPEFTSVSCRSRSGGAWR